MNIFILKFNYYNRNLKCKTNMINLEKEKAKLTSYAYFSAKHLMSGLGLSSIEGKLLKYILETYCVLELFMGDYWVRRNII